MTSQTLSWLLRKKTRPIFLFVRASPLPLQIAVALLGAHHLHATFRVRRMDSTKLLACCKTVWFSEWISSQRQLNDLYNPTLVYVIAANSKHRGLFVAQLIRFTMLLPASHMRSVWTEGLEFILFTGGGALNWKLYTLQIALLIKQSIKIRLFVTVGWVRASNCYVSVSKGFMFLPDWWVSLKVVLWALIDNKGQDEIKCTVVVPLTGCAQGAIEK